MIVPNRTPKWNKQDSGTNIQCCGDNNGGCKDDGAKKFLRMLLDRLGNTNNLTYLNWEGEIKILKELTKIKLKNN